MHTHQETVGLAKSYILTSITKFFISLLYLQVCSDLVLRELVAERFPRSGKLTELATNHFIGHFKFNVFFTVVDLEFQPNKLGQYRARSGVGSDGSTSFNGVGNRQRNHAGPFPCRSSFKQYSGSFHSLWIKRKMHPCIASVVL